MQAIGLAPGTGDSWVWSAACGQTGTVIGPQARERARESYKEHRSQCDTCSAAPTISPSNTTMPDTKKAPAAKKDKPAAKPAAAKKPKAPKKEKKARKHQAVTEVQAKAALQRLKEGKTTLRKESSALGYTYNGPLRAALRTLLGREKYDALMTAKPATKKDKPAAKKAPKDKPAAAKPVAKPAAKKSKPAKKRATVEGPAAGRSHTTDIVDDPTAAQEEPVAVVQTETSEVSAS